MKMNDKIVKTTGNLQNTEEVLMRMSPKASALILNNLIKMYSDPYTAVVREYTSNARDSHVAAGQTRPVELSTPTALSPNLVVQDWGPVWPFP